MKLPYSKKSESINQSTLTGLTLLLGNYILNANWSSPELLKTRSGLSNYMAAVFLAFFDALTAQNP